MEYVSDDDDDNGTTAQYRIVRRGQALDVKDGVRHLSLGRRTFVPDRSIALASFLG